MSSAQKRKKGYYIQSAKGKKVKYGRPKLDFGMRGMLITCNKYERETIAEAHNLFNEYAEEMYGPEKV
jgi:tRNA acetyltransferase TAN1